VFSVSTLMYAKMTETCVSNVVMCLLNCSNVSFSVIFPVEMFIDFPVYQCCFASHFNFDCSRR